MKFLSYVAVLASVLSGGVRAGAETSPPFSITVPDFLIPLGGQTSTLDVYSDGRDPQVTGYNVLGNQRVTLPSRGVSAGSLTLNLHLPAFDAGGAGAIVESARLQFSVHDLDFTRDSIYPNVTLVETAGLTAVNGVRLAQPINFMDLLPAGTTDTDGRTVTLDPIILSRANVPWVDFSQPYVLTFDFTATITTRADRSYTINNAPEGIANDLTITYQPLVPVPEPGTVTLMGVGALALLIHVLRRHAKA